MITFCGGRRRWLPANSQKAQVLYNASKYEPCAGRCVCESSCADCSAEDDSSGDYDTSDTDTSDSDDGTEDDTEFDYPTEEETFPSDYADTGDYTGTDVYTDNNWQLF